MVRTEETIIKEINASPTASVDSLFYTLPVTRGPLAPIEEMGESRQMASMSSDNCPLFPPRIGYDVGQRPHTSFQVCPDAEILRRSHVRQVGEKHRKEGFLHVFWRL